MISRLSSPERLALAASPSTSPEDLATLAADGNLQVRRAAGANPAAPQAIIKLLTSAGATPGLVGLGSPPQDLAEQDIETLIGLGEFGRRLASRHPDAGADALGSLATDPLVAVRLGVARHPRCPTSTLPALCADVDADVRGAAAKHPNTPRHVVELFITAGGLPDLSGCATVHDDPDAPGKNIDLSQVIATGPWGKQLAARHPLAGRDLLQSLAQDADWSVRAAVAENPSADASLLASLADLDTFEVKLTVAQHPHSPADTLQQIADEPDTRLRLAVASNPNLAPALLRRLACDGSSVVRQRAAEHPAFATQDRALLVAAGSSADLMGFATPDRHLDPASIDDLARLGDWGRQLAARHPATSTTTLEQLVTAGDPMLREAVLDHPARPDELIHLLVSSGSSPDLQGFGPPSGTLAGDDLSRLMKLGPWARRLAARHADTDAVSLHELSQDLDPQTRRAVARHPHAQDPTLTALSDDVSHEVRWTLVNRDALPAPALQTLLRDPLATIRLAAVEHPHTPREAIEMLRFDLDEDVRAAVKAKLLATTG